MPFYFATLEEYYSGGLFLPVCNGVTDGSVPLIGVYFFTAYVGNDWWRGVLDVGGH